MHSSHSRCTCTASPRNSSISRSTTTTTTNTNNLNILTAINPFIIFHLHERIALIRLNMRCVECRIRSFPSSFTMGR